jgi:hypothetical protein
VLQAAQSDQAFAFAIVSLAAAQQLYEYDDISTAGFLGVLAMQQYGMALQLIRSSSQNRSIEAVLICCALFASFESLRGCRRSAVVHIKSGLNLLRQTQSYATWSLVSERTMLSVFTRLNNQLVEMLGTSIIQEVNDKGIDATNALRPISSVPASHDIYYSLDSLLNHIFHHRLSLALIKEGRIPLGGPLLSQEQRREALEQWHQSIPSLDSQGDEKVNCKPRSLAAEVLQIWSLLAKMCIPAWFGSESEEAWDTFSLEFDSIVTLSESYLARTTSVLRLCAKFSA